MFGFGLLAYVQQKSLTVAAAQMMPDLGLSQMQIGYLQQAFVIGYTVLQLPGGVFGQRLGARRTLVVLGIVSFLAMIAMPIAPHLFAGAALFIVLLGAQLLLGFSQAPIFPVSSGVFEAWFPSNRWAFVQGLQTMGLGFGSALTALLIPPLALAVGWQGALVCAALPAVALIAGWAWYARDTPKEHRAVSPEELVEIGNESAAAVDSTIDARRLIKVLTNRSVWLLATSYVMMNYAFYLLSNWCFLYLVQERHLSLLASGGLASMPALASGIGAGVGGALTSRLCESFGTRWGYRLTPLVALPIAGLLLIVAVTVANAYLAVVALTACFFCVELTEGSYWGGAMSVGRGDSMAVCGVMNTGGNLGGILGIPIVAYLSGHGSWPMAFVIGAGCAVASALAWFGIDPSRPLDAVEKH